MNQDSPQLKMSRKTTSDRPTNASTAMRRRKKVQQTQDDIKYFKRELKIITKNSQEQDSYKELSRTLYVVISLEKSRRSSKIN